MSENKQTTLFIGGAILIVIIIVGVLTIVRSKEKSDQDVLADVSVNIKDVAIPQKPKNEFLGEKGETLTAIDNKVYIEETKVSDGNIHFYNYYSEENQKTIYFFIVKADDGTHRVAANACESCFGSKKGFTQVGDLIRCENCKVTYSKDQIAREKGGCNPRPIEKAAMVENENLIINVSDIEGSADLF